MPIGAIKPGSYADQVLAAVREARRPVSRAELIAGGLNRRFLNRALDHLVAGNWLRECSLGFLPFEAPRLKPAEGAERPPVDLARPELEPTPEPLRAWLDAIAQRARTLAEAGHKGAAVLLLNQTARQPRLPAHISASFGALADLFRHHHGERAA